MQGEERVMGALAQGQEWEPAMAAEIFDPLFDRDPGARNEGEERQLSALPCSSSLLHS